MKKYLIVLSLLLVPFFTKAEVPNGAFFFQDNKGYDLSGQQRYFCLADSNCYTVKGDFAFSREQVKGVSTTTPTIPTPVVPTSTPVSLENGRVDCMYSGVQNGDFLLNCLNIYQDTKVKLNNFSYTIAANSGISSIDISGKNIFSPTFVLQAHEVATQTLDSIFSPASNYTPVLQIKSSRSATIPKLLTLTIGDKSYSITFTYENEYYYRGTLQESN